MKDKLTNTENATLLVKEHSDGPPLVIFQLYNGVKATGMETLLQTLHLALSWVSAVQSDLLLQRWAAAGSRSFQSAHSGKGNNRRSTLLCRQAVMLGRSRYSSFFDLVTYFTLGHA